MPLSPEDLVRVLPKAIAWIAECEERIMRYGERLTPGQLLDAKAVGVNFPERVRLLRVPSILFPLDPELAALAVEEKLITQTTDGLTARYGIFVCARAWTNRHLIAHELTHTAQYERLGGIGEFLSVYIPECNGGRYPDTPMERDAEANATRICA